MVKDMFSSVQPHLSGIIISVMKVSLFSRRSLVVWLAAAGWLGLALPAGAALSQGYTPSGTIPTGSLVALSADGTKVEAADPNNLTRLFGVVVPPAASQLSLVANGQVQVVTTGSAAVIVSTAAGDIKTGDPITVSTVAGVGMKATGTTRIIGTALGDFNSGSPGAEQGSVGSGSSAKAVTFGEVKVQVGVTEYQGKASGSFVPNAVQNLVNTVAGKPVAPIKLTVIALIMLAAVISSSVLLYSAVRSGIVAVGRNPLAKGAVFRSLFQILGLVGGILVAATIVIVVLVK